MTLAGMKEVFKETARDFFGDRVYWAEQKAPRPVIPFITLKVNSIMRDSFPISAIDESGYTVKAWKKTAVVEMNIYTGGQPLGDMGGPSRKTAMEDMGDFINFLESDEIEDRLFAKDIVIQLPDGVQDLSFLINGTTYRYRAMAEFRVTFTDIAVGPYGQRQAVFVPNASMGGNEHFVFAEPQYFTEVEIEEENNE